MTDILLQFIPVGKLIGRIVQIIIHIHYMQCIVYILWRDFDQNIFYMRVLWHGIYVDGTRPDIIYMLESYIYSGVAIYLLYFDVIFYKMMNVFIQIMFENWFTILNYGSILYIWYKPIYMYALDNLWLKRIGTG